MYIWQRIEQTVSERSQSIRSGIGIDLLYSVEYKLSLGDGWIDTLNNHEYIVNTEKWEVWKGIDTDTEIFARKTEIEALDSTAS